MKKSSQYLFVTLILVGELMLSQSAFALIRYVDINATFPGNGKSWDTAYTSLQTALTTASSEDEIWVAKGTYYPTIGLIRTISFILKTGIKIYGGFKGTESVREERNWMTNVTILSGDIGTINVNTDNSYHVVVSSGTDNTTILDGFTLSKGNANWAGADSYGGGIYNNTGSPTITNIIISGNSAHYGGGMYNNNDSIPNLSNIIISGNSANYGGGMYNNSSNPNLSSITISGNLALEGGGMYNNNSNPTLSNAIVWGNEDDNGVNSMANYSSSPVITDSIIQDFKSSLVTFLTWAIIPLYPLLDNSNNIDADPLFMIPIDPKNSPSTAGNFHLKPTSPAIDVGNNSVPNMNTTDLEGHPRIMNDKVDMGAYEFKTP